MTPGAVPGLVGLVLVAALAGVLAFLERRRTAAELDALDAELDELEAFEPHRCQGCAEPSSTVLCATCAELMTCGHGRRRSECNACDVAEDLAFDAARERRS